MATPGCLLDLAHQNAVDLSQVEILVLDKADRMLDMDFIHDIRRVPAKRQNLLSRPLALTRSKHWQKNC